MKIVFKVLDKLSLGSKIFLIKAKPLDFSVKICYT